MEITVYAKKRHTKEGKTFYTYLTKLTRKDGEEITTSIKFNDNGTNTAPRPEDCPCNIIVEKTDCNFSSKAIKNAETGEITISNTLWVNSWRLGSAYQDHSMDDFI